METIKAFLSGIFGGFNTLVPISYEGHKKLAQQLYINMNGGGYDSILPVVIQFGVIIALIYFLRNDLLELFKTAGHLFKDILNKEFSIKNETKETNRFYMVVMTSAVFLLTPAFSFIFSAMSKNFLIISAAFLISGIFLYMAENTKEEKLSEKNEVPFNAVSVGIFKLLSIVPGFSGLGGMYFCGILNGFTKEFSLKFAYIITLVAMTASFISNIIRMFFYVNIIYNVFGYILAFVGAAVLSYLAIELTSLAMRKNCLKYFGFYNIIIAIFIFLIWIRG